MESLLSLALSNAATATLLALIAAAGGCLCRRPAVRHALWLLVLLKLITPPLVPVFIGWPKTQTCESPPAEVPPDPILMPSAAEIAGPVGDVSEMMEPVAMPATEPASVQFAIAEFGMPVALVLWLGGALGWWTIAAVRLRRFQR